VLVDCEPIYYNMDPWAVERALTTRTKAVVPVHSYGHPADMDPLLEIARQRKLSVLEDAAQAHGASYKGRLCGTLGDIGCFSFSPEKNLGACGDAGAIVTHRAELARRVAALRNYGQRQKNIHLVKGFNSRLDTLQAAVLRVKLRYLHHWTERRAAAATRYVYLLRSTALRLPEIAPWASPAWHLFVAQTRDRRSLQSALEADEIGYGVHYPTPVHLQEAYRDLGYARGSFPVAEWLASRIISLPLFPEITDAELQRVARACRRGGWSEVERVPRLAPLAQV
jgi:dTDP-4-amino-4,6-dideoxygalactose transaminase